MKKLIKTIILALLLVININVYAEDAWPKEITYNDFSILIEGFDLRVYKIDKDSPVHETNVTTENGTLTGTITEDGENFINEVPIKIINLKASDFTINPEFKEEKLLDLNTIFIGLNLKLTKEKLQELLSEEYNQVSENRGYIVELVVNYQVTDFPEKYNYIYKKNLFRDMLTMYDQNSSTKVLDLTKTNYQSLNMISLMLKEGTNEKTIFYEDEILDNSDEDVSAYVYNYQLFSTTDEQTDETEAIGIMFHNITNIDKFIERSEELGSVDLEDFIYENDVNPLTSTAVKVDNTAAFRPNMVFIVGGVLLLYGIAFLLYATYNNKKKSYNE